VSSVGRTLGWLASTLPPRKRRYFADSHPVYSNASQTTRLARTRYPRLLTFYSATWFYRLIQNSPADAHQRNFYHYACGFRLLERYGFQRGEPVRALTFTTVVGAVALAPFATTPYLPVGFTRTFTCLLCWPTACGAYLLHHLPAFTTRGHARKDDLPATCLVRLG